MKLWRELRKFRLIELLYVSIFMLALLPLAIFLTIGGFVLDIALRLSGTSPKDLIS